MPLGKAFPHEQCGTNQGRPVEHLSYLPRHEALGGGAQYGRAEGDDHTGVEDEAAKGKGVGKRD